MIVFSSSEWCAGSAAGAGEWRAALCAGLLCSGAAGLLGSAAAGGRGAGGAAGAVLECFPSMCSALAGREGAGCAGVCAMWRRRRSEGRCARDDRRGAGAASAAADCVDCFTVSCDMREWGEVAERSRGDALPGEGGGVWVRPVLCAGDCGGVSGTVSAGEEALAGGAGAAEGAADAAGASAAGAAPARLRTVVEVDRRTGCGNCLWVCGPRLARTSLQDSREQIVSLNSCSCSRVGLWSQLK